MNLIEALFGKKEFREQESQYSREIFDKTGVDVKKKRGGIVGFFVNKPTDERNASSLNTPGTGKK